MDNELLNIGDEIVVNVNIQASGIVTFTNFVENITGITAQRYVEKYYRATINDVLWDDWKELNLNNLSSKSYHLFDNFIHIQVRYVRAGSDSTGVITFNDITFSGNWQSSIFQAPTLSNSIFASLIGTQDLLLTERNLFKKLYFRGIVPKYIDRGENRNYDEDEDYIALTSAIAKFFAIILCYGKRFENIYNDEELLLEYVKQWGLNVNDGNVVLEDLQNIISNYYNQIHDRGTEMIFKPKGWILPDGSSVKVDGEFLRLFRNGVSDELLYENIERSRIGLCIGNSSPLYRGTGNSKQLNKIYQNEKYIPWNYYGITFSGASGIPYEDELIFNIDDAGGGVFTFNDLSAVDFDKILVCDHNLDYEITFEIRKVQVGNLEMTAKIFGYDVNKLILNDAFCKTDESSIENTFTANKPLNDFEDGVWYKIRFIVRSYQSVSIVESNDDVNIINLKFNNGNTKYFVPQIEISGDQGNNVNLKNINIRPLVRGKNILPSKNDGRVDAFSLGFIQSSDIFHTYARSNNNNIRQRELLEIVEKYLYPFNSVNVFTVISQYE